MTRPALLQQKPENLAFRSMILNFSARKLSKAMRAKIHPLHMAHEKLVRILSYFWVLVAFPVAVAILVSALTHSANLGIKTFLLIECGMAVLSPLLNAVIGDDNHKVGAVGKCADENGYCDRECDQHPEVAEDSH